MCALLLCVQSIYTMSCVCIHDHVFGFLEVIINQLVTQRPTLLRTHHYPLWLLQGEHLGLSACTNLHDSKQENKDRRFGYCSISWRRGTWHGRYTTVCDMMPKVVVRSSMYTWSKCFHLCIKQNSLWSEVYTVDDYSWKFILGTGTLKLTNTLIKTEDQVYPQYW